SSTPGRQIVACCGLVQLAVQCNLEVCPPLIAAGDVTAQVVQSTARSHWVEVNVYLETPTSWATPIGRHPEHGGAPPRRDLHAPEPALDGERRPRFRQPAATQGKELESQQANQKPGRSVAHAISKKAGPLCR